MIKEIMDEDNQHENQIDLPLQIENEIIKEKS